MTHGNATDPDHDGASKSKQKTTHAICKKKQKTPEPSKEEFRQQIEDYLSHLEEFM